MYGMHKLRTVSKRRSSREPSGCGAILAHATQVEGPQDRHPLCCTAMLVRISPAPSRQQRLHLGTGQLAAAVESK
jgi:hypothetical protein